MQTQEFLTQYIHSHKATLDSIPLTEVAEVISKFKEACTANKQIFMFGNGGSAANASHFATDLGKGSSDKIEQRFRCLSLNDNVSWLTALGNDYAYEDVFMRQLINYANAGDIVFAMSVSGNSPNVVKAVEWAKQNNVQTIALTGAAGGRLADIADKAIVINSTHYGRVEDAHMGICHMICYSFMELKHLR